MTLSYTLKHEWIDAAKVARFRYTNPEDRGLEETPVAVMDDGTEHQLDADDFNLYTGAANAHQFTMLLVNPEKEDDYWVPVGDVRKVQDHPTSNEHFTVILTDGSSVVSHKQYVFQCFPALAHPLLY
ncbi:hypothetical protein ACLI1C_18840 [Devosia sp. XGJD_8]|uniref:hypothetical protein n=1 Tax=Devosia sp. XGJD_8 TaxID=3391187 RepID=UPI0039850224